MKTDCAMYRSEKKGNKEYYFIKEYCDGLEDPFCKHDQKCPFYKPAEEWRAVIVKKQTQYIKL